MAPSSRGFFRSLFIFIVLLIVVIWFIPAPLIKWGIEKYGTEAVGAKVDVGKVDFSWLSARLELHDLAVTNPQQPMTNLVAFAQISTEANVAEMLAGQVYLNEVAIEGVALDSPRQSSGAVPGLTPSGAFAEEDNGFSIPGVSLPDTTTLVNEERAVYEKRIKEIEADIDRKKQEWQTLQNSLPDKDKLAAYKKRWKELKDKKDPMGRIQAVKDIKEMSEEMKSDVKAFEKVQDQIKADYKGLQQKVATVKSFPDKSYAEIIETLGLQESKLANLGANLLEGPMRAWLDKGYNYYRLMSGGEAGKSDTEEVAVSKTAPAIFVEMTKLSGPFTQGKLAGEIKGTIENFSDAPALSGKPILINLLASGGKIGKINLEGEIDHSKKGAEQDKLHLKVVDTALQDFQISKSESMNVLLKQALLNIDAEASIASLKSLNINFDSIFKSLELATQDAANSSKTQQTVIKALQDLSELSLVGNARGTVSDPELNLSSNLDDVLKAAFGDVIKEKTQAFKKELTSKLNAQLDEKMTPLKSKLQDAFGINAEIVEQQQLFAELRKSLLK
ncbi:MAG: TIGR03545 family protein [Pseudomonadales bacterium]|nr:TIGR03545 family protein [Pseudomonadales bacterium]